MRPGDHAERDGRGLGESADCAGTGLGGGAVRDRAEAVPVVRDIEAAKRDPELAVLSSMAHGKGEMAPEVALAALAAAAGLDEERALLYFDVIMASLSEASRSALEKLMAIGNYEYQSEFVKAHRAEGRALGEATGRALGVIQVLEVRGVMVSEEQRSRILAYTATDVLDRLIRRAVSVTTADELFVD